MVAIAVSADVDRDSCRIERRTLETAVEAHQAIEGRPPRSVADLLDADLLRQAPTRYDLIDGRVVPTEGSGCRPVEAPSFALDTGPEPAIADSSSAPAEGTEAAGTASATTASTTTPLSRPECAAVAVALDRLAEVGADGTGQVATELAEVADLLQVVTRDAGSDLRADIEMVAALVDSYALNVRRLEATEPHADTETAQVIGNLVDVTPGMVRASTAREWLTTTAPTLVTVCELSPAGLRDQRAIEAFVEALGDFLETEIAQGAEFADLRELGELMLGDRGSTASSAFSNEFLRCRKDLTAHGPGDNPACDALYEACDARDLLACNDLYYVSPVGSLYESFAATCGERIQFPADGFGGYCEELDR